ncbi:FtsX-like permease family protein [Streptomyces sp. NPDC001380]|uniref:FtsX-like permease family protein n=1 Tax=Streptomyces sp. NPDC001380 TaxID=3364566 RepID=UPI0036BF2E05
MRAELRWAAADCRARPGQALLVTLVTASVVTALMVAGVLLQDAVNPWQRIFSESSGAHVWLHLDAGTGTAALSRLDGVDAVAGPYRTAVVTVPAGTGKLPLELRAAGSAPPRISRPLLRSGRWLDPAEPDGVVLERTAARAAGAAAGARLAVRTADGRTRVLRVLGTADTADSGPCPDWTPGLGWVLPGTLDAVGPADGRTGLVAGLRLHDPADTDFAVQQAVTALGGARVARVSTWQQVRTAGELDGRLLGLLLGVFGLVSLVAVALAAAGAAGERVLAQVGDIAMLKAVGFTPAQVVRMVVYQHAALALAGVALGTAGAALLGPVLPDPVGPAVARWHELPGGAVAASGAAVAGGVVLLVVAAVAAVPAWRAGRVPAVPGIRGVRRVSRLSRLARLALLLRLPPALVLGARDAFHRPLRAGLTVARLAIPVMAVTVALGSWATLDGFRTHPERIGLPAALTARAPGLSPGAVQRLLAGTPGVRAAYAGVETEALVPGQTRTVTLRGLGTAAAPYPYALAEGRGIRDRDEAVAGQGLLDLMHVRVGQWVRVTTAGTPRILHVVGRSIEPEHNGQMLSVGLDALEGRDGPPPPQYWNVVLAPGADREAVRAALAAASGGRLDVRPVANPADRLGAVRVVVAGLVAVLGLIGLAELLTATAGGLRDHARDLGVLRAMGLTPRQVTAVVTTGTGLTALAAVAVGVLLGLPVSRWLIDLQGRSSGIGSGIAGSPSPGALLLTCAVAVAAAVCVPVVPAARAARAPVTAALRST